MRPCYCFIRLFVGTIVQVTLNMADQDSIHNLVASNFGPVASNYATSAGHANADALAELVQIVCPTKSNELLDIATGAGNVALAFAPYVSRVIALDLTPAMLEQTLKTAAARGLENVEVVEGLAEDLPFDDSRFDIVTVRLAPHHYADIRQAIREMARVVKTHGKVLIVDTTVPEDDSLDREINEIDKLRDNSHVRNYRVSEWKAYLKAEGLRVIVERNQFYTEGFEMDFDAWIERIRTPETDVIELRWKMRNASPALAETLKINIYPDGKIGFVLPQLTLLATKD